MKQYPQEKIFCIGLNKTGTTSIGDALAILGYNRLGWKGRISGPLTSKWHEGNTNAFLTYTREYEAFEDIPWCFVYEKMLEVYPKAKFILTTRKNTDTWLKSIQSHIARRGDWYGHYLIYGSYDPFTDSLLYIDKYEKHNKEVRDFFSDKPNKLLELSFDKGDGWDELCPFLGLNIIPDQAFPHSNSKPEDKEV